MARITYRKSDLRGWYSVYRNGRYFGEAEGKKELTQVLKVLRKKK